MIVSKTPFRISFMGGRSDFPSFYEREEGAVVATSINKYVYISVSGRFDRNYELHFDEKEEVNSVDKIEHPIVRAALESYAPARGGISISSNSEIPSGTGLGSSSSFTVGLLNALQGNLGIPYNPKRLAEEACELEIKKINCFTGKQDQYCAAFGGLSYIRFLTNGEVVVEPVSLPEKNKKTLEEHICLFYTGIRRDGAEVLQAEQKTDNFDLVKEMRDLAREFKNELEGLCSFKNLGAILDTGWKIKKEISRKVSNSDINDFYKKAINAGAYGGKLLGAGGGGYLLFLCPPEKQEDLKSALNHLTLLELGFESEGSQIILWK